MATLGRPSDHSAASEQQGLNTWPRVGALPMHSPGMSTRTLGETYLNQGEGC